MRFSRIVMAYVVIGSVMWAGGALAWEDVGMASVFISQPGTDGPTEVNDATGDQLEGLGGPIQQAVQSVGGSPIVAVWNLAAKFIGFLFWPIVILAGANAPATVTVVLGGGMTAAFFGSIFRLLRTSA
jgi:peptidoglycan/LPS O-acetylase OafA/YrhL